MATLTGGQARAVTASTIKVPGVRYFTHAGAICLLRRAHFDFRLFNVSNWHGGNIRVSVLTPREREMAMPVRCTGFGLRGCGLA